MMDISYLLADESLLKNPEDILGIVAISGGILIALVSIITCTIKGCVKTGQTEQTRREIAAYIAEGSISPEDGERLMKTAGHQSLISKL